MIMLCQCYQFCFDQPAPHSGVVNDPAGPLYPPCPTLFKQAGTLTPLLGAAPACGIHPCRGRSSVVGHSTASVRFNLYCCGFVRHWIFARLDRSNSRYPTHCTEIFAEDNVLVSLRWQKTASPRMGSCTNRFWSHTGEHALVWF